MTACFVAATLLWSDYGESPECFSILYFEYLWPMAILPPPPFFGPDNEESLRSGRDKSFPIKNIPALKTRNNKAATKQKNDW